MSEKMMLNCERFAVLMCVVMVIGLLSAFVLPTFDPGVPGVALFAVISVTLCIAHAAASKGWKKALGFTVVSFVISWFVEFIGCNYGWWFGDYAYTPVLGYAIGNVPVLIVFSWEALIYPSLLIVDDMMEHPTVRLSRGQWLAKIFLASAATGLVATTWDLMGDPVAIHLNWWQWDFGGAYMPELAGGVPFSNMWGWAGAVFIISFLYKCLFTRSLEPAPVGRSPLLFAVSLFTAWFCSVSYSCIHHGLQQPLFIGVFSMGIIVLFCWGRYFFRELVGAEAMPATSVE